MSNDTSTSTTEPETTTTKEEADVKMKEIFKIFDKDGDGTVSFQEVVIEMYELTNDLSQSSKAAVTALLMIDGSGSNTNASSNDDNGNGNNKGSNSKGGRSNMNYEQFSRFFLLVVAACYGDMTFEEVAERVIESSRTSSNDKLTPEEIYAKFEMDANLQKVFTLHNNNDNDGGDNNKEESGGAAAVSQGEVDAVDTFQVNRSSRLFDLWDLNGDGFIDFHELALSLRYVSIIESLLLVGSW